MKIGAGNFRLFWILLTIGLIQTRIVIYAQAQQLEYKVLKSDGVKRDKSRRSPSIGQIPLSPA